jgi:hypothetical protein
MKTLKIRKREQVVDQQNENVIEEQEPEQELEQDDEVSTIAPPTDEVCKKLFLLCSKIKMRLVLFLFKILMMLCSEMKRKWKSWTK